MHAIKHQIHFLSVDTCKLHTSCKEQSVQRARSQESRYFFSFYSSQPLSRCPSPPTASLQFPATSPQSLVQSPCRNLIKPLSGLIQKSFQATDLMCAYINDIWHKLAVKDAHVAVMTKGGGKIRCTQRRMVAR